MSVRYKLEKKYLLCLSSATNCKFDAYGIVGRQVFLLLSFTQQGEKLLCLNIHQTNHLQMHVTLSRIAPSNCLSTMAMSTSSSSILKENGELLKRGTDFAATFHLSTPIVNDYHIFFRRDRLIIVMVSWDNSGRNQLSTC